MDGREVLCLDAPAGHEVLCLDAPAGREAARRLAALGLAVRTATPEAVAAEGAGRARAVVLDADLPLARLERVLAALEHALVDGTLTGLAAGPPPPAIRRARLREAGVTLGLFEPLDDATLRHQVNRAFLGGRRPGPARRELRVPLGASALLVVRRPALLMPATLYSLSEGGAFVETPRVVPRGTRAEVRLALGASGLRLPATVMHVHEGEQASRAPTGMGLRFDTAPPPALAALRARVRARTASLVV